MMLRVMTGRSKGNGHDGDDAGRVIMVVIVLTVLSADEGNVGDDVCDASQSEEGSISDGGDDNGDTVDG